MPPSPKMTMKRISMPRSTSFINCKSIPSWDLLFLDNQSMVDQFLNPKYLNDIIIVEQETTVYCNGGILMTNKNGKFDTLEVWYNPDSVMNVILLKTMTKHYKVMYDSDDRGGVFIVHAHGKKFKFVCHKRGLHYLDLNKKQNAEILMAITLEKNFECFTDSSPGSNKSQAPAGNVRPSIQQEFEELFCEKLIANCPITKIDVTNACKIFSPDLAGLRGKQIDRQLIDWIIKMQMAMSDS